MTGYPKDKLSQESSLHDFFTGAKVQIADLVNDVILMVNRASSPAQEATHDSKFAFMDTLIGDVGKRVIKRAFTGSGKLTPLYEFNESHGLNHGYRDSWFGDLEDIIEEALRQSFPGQRVTVVMLTPDRFARPQHFHPYYPLTWWLTGAHFKQMDTWLTARFGNRRKRFRFLTCFAGTPSQCRGLQSKIGMHYSGNIGGRPKGSRNKKPRITLTPKQKTAFRKMLRDEISHLVGELGLNGTQCYKHFKSIYNYIPVIRETVCRWVAKARGTPGMPGRPAGTPDVMKPKKTESDLESTSENKCVISKHRSARPTATHPHCCEPNALGIENRMH